MKKMLFPFLISLFLGFAASAQNTDTVQAGAATVPAEGPVLAFVEKSHDFGDIKQGEKVSYTFTFTNTGNKPLIISNVATTCGCTVSKWTKEPVAPGKSGEVSATFDSTGKMSMQKKVVTVYSNSATGIQTVSLVTNVLPNNSRSQR
jgi:hypothetical protein